MSVSDLSMNMLTRYGCAEFLDALTRKRGVFAAVRETVGGVDVWKVLEYGLLHCQLRVPMRYTCSVGVLGILCTGLCRGLRRGELGFRGRQPWS